MVKRASGRDRGRATEDAHSPGEGSRLNSFLPNAVMVPGYLSVWRGGYRRRTKRRQLEQRDGEKSAKHGVFCADGRRGRGSDRDRAARPGRARQEVDRSRGWLQELRPNQGKARPGLAGADSTRQGLIGLATSSSFPLSCRPSTSHGPPNRVCKGPVWVQAVVSWGLC